MTELIGAIAAFLTTASFLPQAIKTIKTRDTSGISFVMYLMFVVGVGFWLAYGVLLENHVIIIANVVTFILAGVVLAVKVKNS
jgi:MtN3 and saliva related transmembrane protein